MFTDIHADAVHQETVAAAPAVADAFQKFRTAGGGILKWIGLLSKYGPAIVEIIDKIIADLNPQPARQ